jgi:hypothetical protein
MKKSKTFGLLLAIISVVSISKPKSFVTKNQSNIAKTIEPIRDFKAVSSHFFTPFAIEKLRALIGRNKGAINMAPITTATEFCNNHRVAITLDKNISIQ